MQSLWEIVASNAVVVVVLAAGVALLGRFWRNPLCLHLLWLLVLLKLATPPLLTVPLPSMPRPAAMPSAEIAATEDLAGPATGEAIEREALATAVDRDEPSSATEVPVLDGPAAEAAVASPVVEEARGIPWAAVLSWTWGTGIVVFGFACAWRTWRFGRLLRTSQAASPAVLEMAAVLAKRLGLRRLPEIRMLSVCVSPLVWSFGGSARVYLPAALFERLDGAAREAIVAHELAHVRRKDHWVRLLEMVVTPLFWWHPVVWWAVRRLRELEDQCCDAMVVDLSPQGVRSYATALLDTLDFLCERSMAAPLGATAAASSESMKRRIAMLKNRSWAVRLGVGHVVLLLGVSALPMALAFGEKREEPTEAVSSALVAAEQEPVTTADRTPSVHVHLTVMEVPRKSDLVRRLSRQGWMETFLSSSAVPAWQPTGGGCVVSEAERKKLVDENRAGVRMEPTLVCPLGSYVSLKGNIGQRSLLACDVIVFWVDRNGALRLRIKPVVTLGRLGKWDEGVKLSRPKDWPVAVLADLKPGEAAVLGGWDDAAFSLPGKDHVTVLIVQAALTEPVKPGEHVVEKRVVNKRLRDFPEKADLSTPESVMAALRRALAKGRVQEFLELCWIRENDETIKEVERELRKATEKDRQDSLNIEIVEVLTYGRDFAAVVHTSLPSSAYAVSYFGRIGGIWRAWRGANEGGNSWPDIQVMEKYFDLEKYLHWQDFLVLRDLIAKKGGAIVVGDKYWDQFAAQDKAPSERPASLGDADGQPAKVLPKKSDSPTSGYVSPEVKRRTINKSVKDFPEKADLSTPESAAAAFNRVLTDPDPAKWLELSAWKYTPRDVEAMRRKTQPNNDEAARARDPYRNAEIVEVLAYRDGLAEVISKVKTPKGADRYFYSSRLFVRIDGQWKNLGEDGSSSVEEARKRFDQIKDHQWDRYVEILEGIKNGKPVMLTGDRPKRSAQIAPDQPLGISVEKADLMGRIEWTFMHGGQDITARKSLEWGEIEKDKDGNRTLRYKSEATIWGKEVMIANQVFTFDAKGNILDVTDVEGYPKKKVEKPKDVNTQKGMKDLVENFFSKNFRDVTSRKTIEWGEVEKTKDGNSSIRHKYRARIWYKETKIMNQVFTFNPKGEFVSVKDVEGFPQPQADEPVKADYVNNQEGMQKLVEDFFDHNFRDVKSREMIEWSDVTKAADGNSSIRYKYRVRIWDKETKIINQVFTFDRNGKFVSVKDVKEAPKKKGEGAGDEAAAGKVDGPAAAVAKFLEAARTGNDETASRMLSTLARQKTANMAQRITPQASNTAKFSVGKVDMVGEDGARVAVTWTDIDPSGKERTDKAVWVLRREPDGWHIAGVVSQVFADAPPVVLNFEDPEEMLRKQQWVREEFRRRESAGAK